MYFCSDTGIFAASAFSQRKIHLWERYAAPRPAVCGLGEWDVPDCEPRACDVPAVQGPASAAGTTRCKK